MPDSVPPRRAGSSPTRRLSLTFSAPPKIQEGREGIFTRYLQMDGPGLAGQILTP